MIIKFDLEKESQEIPRESPDEIQKLLKNLVNEEKAKEQDLFFEVSLDMLCIAGLDGYYKKISRSFTRTLGYTEQELLSMPFIDFVVQEDSSNTDNILTELKNGISTLNFQNRFKCKDGRIIWLEWRSVPIPGENWFYAIARDITEQKKAELQLQELAKHKTESIRYALLLQQAICHDPEALKNTFSQSFVYNAPKDIVSGDFLWFENRDDKIFIAVADCTGHGVPGAMLSVLGVGKLHDVFKSQSITKPSEALDRLDVLVYNALRKENCPQKVDDGMDIAFYSIDLKTNTLEYAGANNSLCIVRNGKMIELTADKQGIGISFSREFFTNNTFQLQTGDMIYTFSDGYKDQFGGENGKKFMYKQFKELLVSVADKSVDEQKKVLGQTLICWQKELEQVDDILIVGVKIE
ncbi:MAG: bacterio-opsin activator [Bacteroidota bacterium]|jgi:PAS domain S-box-containing protein|nr:bacterio-opsin activator [Bacteroidota bacterium]